MSFTMQTLVNDRVLVTGQDVTGTTGKVVLDGSQWVEINGRDDVSKAEAAFEAAVEEFFAPITEAAEKLSKSLERPTDPSSYIVLQEAVEAVGPRPAQLVKLTRDSQIIRLIEEGQTDRLIWVGDDELEILAPSQGNGSSVPSAQDVVVAGAEALGEEPINEQGETLRP